MNIIEQLEAEQAAAIAEKRKLPAFQPGDTVRVNVRVVEGNRTRVQAYEGVCIARSGGAEGPRHEPSHGQDVRNPLHGGLLRESGQITARQSGTRPRPA